MPGVNVIKNILGRFFALYALLLFALTMLLIALPPVFICRLCIRDEKQRTAAIIKIFRLWINVYLPLIFSPVSRRGTSHFRKGENYVVVCNHNALIDIPISTPGVPGANKTLAKKELARIPVFGMVYRSGSILVDRKNAQSRRQSIDKMKQVLEQGMHLVLYPEGTRNKSAQPLKPFYDGAFNIAITMQKPIMPAIIFHTKKILPPHKPFFAWPHRIGLHFLEPVSTEGLTLADLPALKQHVFEMMEKYYVAGMNK